MSKMSTFLDEGRAPVVIDVDYHAPTGKRIPVEVAGLSVTVSGITIGAVEIKDANSSLEAFVGTPTDDFDEYSLATVAHNMAYDGSGGDNWERVRAVYTDVDDVDEDDINPALAVGAIILGLDESDQFDRIRGTEEYGLEVDITRMPLMPVTISGDIEIGAVEIKDASSDTRATVTTDYGLEVDVTRVQGTVAISGIITDLVAVSGLSLLYAYDPSPHYNTPHWDRVKGIRVDTDDYQYPYNLEETLFTGTLLYGLKEGGGPTILNRIRGTANYGLEVDATRIQGTTAVSGISSVYAFDLANTGLDTEIKAVLAIADNIPASDYDPALAVGAIVLGLDESDQFDRIRGTTEYGLETDVTRVQGTVSGVLNAGVIINRLAIDISSNVNILIAGIPDNKIKVLSCMVLASGTTNIAFRSDTASGTRLTGELVLDTSGAGYVLNPPATREMHHFETNTGEALVLTIDPVTYIGGYLNYYVDP